MLRILLVLSMLLSTAGMCFAQSSRPECDDLATRLDFICNAQKLSWVEFTHQTSSSWVKGNVKNIERYLRGAVKKNLPFLEHEVMSFGDLAAKNNYDTTAEGFKNRTALQCHLWTVGSKSGYPVAYHIKLTLWSYGKFVFDKKEAAYLGYCSNNDIESVLKNTINEGLSEISQKYYEGLAQYEMNARKKQSAN